MFELLLTAKYAKVMQRTQKRFIVVADKNINIQKIIKSWLHAVNAPKSIEVRIDVDPISFS